MAKQIKQKQEPKLDRDIIINEFLELRDFVGQNLRFLHDVAKDCQGIENPIAFEEAVLHLTKDSHNRLTDVLKTLAGKFEGLKVKSPGD